MATEEKPTNYWQGDDPEATDEPQEEKQPVEQGVAVTWSAHEYVAREKNVLWYIIFVVVCLGFIALDVFIMQSWTFSILVIVMAIALIIYTNRPARTINYTLSADKGLYVGEALHPLSNFKSFGILEEDGVHSIYLMPVKRFSPGLSVYFPQESGEEIVDILGKQLPIEDLKLDMLDTLVRRLRL